MPEVDKRFKTKNTPAKVRTKKYKFKFKVQVDKKIIEGNVKALNQSSAIAILKKNFPDCIIKSVINVVDGYIL